MTQYTGKFKDPDNPASRFYGTVLSTRAGLHFVEVTRKNAKPVTPFHTIVPVAEFALDSGKNKGYWRQQLRGKDGQWIEMGGGIEWITPSGERKLGIVDGFDDEIERVIVKDSDGQEYKLSADEIKQSAAKAVIPDTEEDPTPTEEEPEFDLDDLLTSLDNEPVSPEEFIGDESKFPVGGEPLEIKDKQGKPLARLHKKKDENGHVSIIFELLVSLLPHELSRLFRNVAQDKKKK